MTDVRAMLRSELASRKSAAAPPSKKRKATTQDDDHDAQEPKKARALEAIQDAEEAGPEDSPADQTESHSEDIPDTRPEAEPEADLPIKQQPDAPTAAAVDEDEWAAFERDVATPPPPDNAHLDPNDAGGGGGGTARVSALNAPATISAEPLTAAELAARAREAESAQKLGRREAEIEEERAEAQDKLMEQFEEMDALEERVRKLREKREAIRRGSSSGGGAGEARESVSTEKVLGETTSAAMGKVEDEESDEDEEDDGWDVWGVGGASRL